MARRYTASELVDDIKRRASVPSNQALFTQDDLIDFLDEELATVIVPKTMSVREEFFVANEDVALVKDQEFYTIPSRAIGSKLRDVTLLVTSNGRTVEVNIPRLSPEQISGKARIGFSTGQFGFFLQGNKVGIYPTPTSSTGTIRLKYFSRPGRLIKETNAAVVSVVNTTTGKITFSSPLPADVIVGNLVDIIGKAIPFSSKALDLKITVKATLTITVDDPAALADVSVGDWVCLAEHSPVPQIPFEAHDVLTQAGIVKVLEAHGDESAMKLAQGKYKEKMDLYLDLIHDRVEGAAKKVVGATSILRFTRTSTSRRR